MPNEREGHSGTAGLPADSGEDGPVFRVKDVLQPFDSTSQGGSAILGFGSDEGVRRNGGRVGAAGGPGAIRNIFARLPVHRPATLYDAGDILCADGDLEAAQSLYADRVAALLERNIRPVALGGGHEIAYGSFLGLARHLGDRLASTNVLIVNFDAHFDLRLASKPNSGTPFREIAELCAARGATFSYLCFGISELGNTSALFNRAKALGVEYRLDEEMRSSNFDSLRSTLLKRLEGADMVYLSIDLDVLPAAVAPGVSAPAARGVALEILEDLVDEILRTGKLTLADIAELNPVFDRDDQTARVAARLAYRLALASRSEPGEGCTATRRRSSSCDRHGHPPMPSDGDEEKKAI
ncbi:formimidoylglutamase [Microvirga brassicacearum]|uniref:Formimidoylglutamase n=1 Tax=Microvirga brassicacearum TaxID=2580413 RepID=A0A5N3PBX8_9HYPH|nr:formimidoylglutamase [Microvirga brassicacearum]KAB0267213.1 formimidoylglutamase [Microvirga brassicacearum]